MKWLLLIPFTLTLAATTCQVASIHSSIASLKFCDTCRVREYNVLVAEYYIGSKLYFDLFSTQGGKVRGGKMVAARVSPEPINPQAVMKINLFIHNLSKDTQAGKNTQLVLGGICLAGVVFGVRSFFHP